MQFQDLRQALLSLKSRWKYFCGIAFCLLLLLITRFYALDADPTWVRIASVCNIDEFYYAETAIYLFKNGLFGPNPIAAIPADVRVLGLFQNIVAFLTLHIFGNSFYGLRGASALAGIAIVLLVLASLRSYLLATGTSKSNTRNFVLLAFVFLIFDFSMVMVSRYMRPMVFETFALALTIFVICNNASRWTMPRVHFFLGLISSAAFLFVYPSMAFLPVGIFAGSVFFSRNKKLLLATCSGFGVSLLCYGLISFLLPHQAEEVALTQHFFHRLHFFDTVGNVRRIFESAVFRSSPATFFLFLFFLPIAIYDLLKRKHQAYPYIVAILLAHFFQLTFLNDRPDKKLTTLVPYVVFFIFSGMAAVVRDWRSINWSGERVLLILAWLAFAFKLSLDLSQTSGKAPFALFEGIGLGTVSLLVTAGLILSGFGYLLMVGKSRPIGVKVFAVLVLLLFPALSYRHTYVGEWRNKTFHYRDFLLETQKYLNGETLVYFVGYGAQLYNDAKVSANVYKYQYTPAGRKFMEGFFKKALAEQSLKFVAGYALKNLYGTPITPLTSTMGCNGHKLTLYRIDYDTNTKDKKLL